MIYHFTKAARARTAWKFPDLLLEPDMTEQVWDILRVATVIKPSIVIEITKLPMIQ